MKLRQRIALVACAILLGAFTGVGTSHAQIWARYDCQIANVFFNPVTGGVLLPVSSFVDFAGNFDPDDGVYNDVPTGFTFDYDGSLFSSVNVCINGWLSVGHQATPTICNDNNYLFRPNPPKNAIAPFWGDHFYRTLDPGYTPSQIQYSITAVPSPDSNSSIGAMQHTFTCEWKDLNIIDKNNPNSVATFQVKIIENPMAYDLAVPDKRATIELHYGNLSLSLVSTAGATVGIKDSGSYGSSFMNGLYPSSVAGGDSTRLSSTKKTSSWPPSGLPSRVIQFVPKGTYFLNQWGDGDANLTQVTTSDANVATHQNLFVTIADADVILRSRTNVANGSNLYFGTLDSVEGGPAFHGDCNHNGRYQNPRFPLINFYRATSYDAAYILLYLAAKLSVLPWPDPLPTPPYKEASGNGTNVSGIALDTRNGHLIGNTYTVPVVLRGTVNGALSVEAVVKTDDQNAVQFVGTHSEKGNVSLMHSNGNNGAVVLATAGNFSDGAVLGYLEFNVAQKHDVTVSLNQVSINDEAFASPSTNLPLSTQDVASAANGFAVEQNVPNPFNMNESNTTSIKFTMGATQPVSIRVFDMLGHEVRTLVSNESMTTGAHTIQWDGRSTNGATVANGLYYYQITTASFTQTVKMEVIR